MWRPLIHIFISERELMNSHDSLRRVIDKRVEQEFSPGDKICVVDDPTRMGLILAFLGQTWEGVE